MSLDVEAKKSWPRREQAHGSENSSRGNSHVTDIVLCPSSSATCRLNKTLHSDWLLIVTYARERAIRSCSRNVRHCGVTQVAGSLLMQHSTCCGEEPQCGKHKRCLDMRSNRADSLSVIYSVLRHRTLYLTPVWTLSGGVDQRAPPLDSHTLVYPSSDARPADLARSMSTP